MSLDNQIVMQVEVVSNHFGHVFMEHTPLVIEKSDRSSYSAQIRIIRIIRNQIKILNSDASDD